MLTQKAPFEEEYEQAVAFSILNEEPEPVTSLRSGLSVEIDRVLGKLLAKDREQRYQHADDLLVDLRQLQSASAPSGSWVSPASAPIRSKTKGPKATPWLYFAAGALVATLAGLLLTVLRGPEPQPDRAVRRFSIPAKNAAGEIDVSPDGQYIAIKTDDQKLRIRSLADDSEIEPPGAEDLAEQSLSWSPDSQSIAFATTREVKRVSPEGGGVMTVCELPNRYCRGTAWSPDGKRIVFASGGALYEVSSGGGEPQLLPEAKSDESIGSIWWPSFLPAAGGPEAVIFIAPIRGSAKAWALNRETNDLREIGLAGGRSRYSPRGYLVLQRTYFPETGLWALPFSRSDLTPTGEAFRIEQAGASPSLTDDDSLFFLDDSRAELQNLAWFDRGGVMLETFGPSQLKMKRPALSPDGRRIAVSAREDGDVAVWIHDLDRGSKTLLHAVTFGLSPAWSPDGGEVAFSSRGIFAKASDGTGEARLLVPSAGDVDYRSDGRYVAFVMGEGIGYSKISEDGEASDPQVFVSEGNAGAPVFSPNGRYLAYVSAESGRREIVVRRFPDGGGRQPVSLNGGTQPRWRRDGRELFYVEGTTLMATPVAYDSEGLRLGRPIRLFENEGLRAGGRHAEYDVSPDGQKFVIPTRSEDAEDPVIRAIINWDRKIGDR